MGGTTLPREVLGASLSRLVSCHTVAGDGGLPPAAVAAAKEPCPLHKTTLLPLLKVRPWSLGCFCWFWELILHVFFGATGVGARSESVSSFEVHSKSPSRRNSGFCCHRYLKILHTMLISAAHLWIQDRILGNL